MEEPCIFVVKQKYDRIMVYFNGSLLYASVIYQIVKRMNATGYKCSFDLFIFEEILEFNEEIAILTYEFCKAFLYFAKEYNSGAGYC